MRRVEIVEDQEQASRKMQARRSQIRRNGRTARNPYAARDLETAAVKRELREAQRDGGIFAKQMSINSKTRFVDTTLTAFKLLGNAYTEMQDVSDGPGQLKITKGLIKEILGPDAKSDQRRAKSPNQDPIIIPKKLI